MNRLSTALLVVTSFSAALPLGLPLFAGTTQASQSQGSPGAGLGASRVALADGMRAEASVLTTKALLDPETGTTVVPVSVHIEVLFGGVTLFQSRLLKLPAAGTAEPIGMTGNGIGPSSAEPALAGVLPNRSYLMQVRPRPGTTWSEVRNETDVVLSVEER
ncbi:MAG: hypothetical protein NTY35_16115 [Planctomycetota bacterium]|nr:hypothetical protein [Planctomycetota bacterium]